MPRWTEDDDAILIRLWTEGHSASVIAQRLSLTAAPTAEDGSVAERRPAVITRNAVLGRLHRLGRPCSRRRTVSRKTYARSSFADRASGVRAAFSLPSGPPARSGRPPAGVNTSSRLPTAAPPPGEDADTAEGGETPPSGGGFGADATDGRQQTPPPRGARFAPEARPADKDAPGEPSCCWPLWPHGASPDGRYCRAARTHGSYCARHAAVAFSSRPGPEDSGGRPRLRREGGSAARHRDRGARL
jgi:hypothetical protein